MFRWAWHRSIIGGLGVVYDSVHHIHSQFSSMIGYLCSRLLRQEEHVQVGVASFHHQWPGRCL